MSIERDANTADEILSSKSLEGGSLPSATAALRTAERYVGLLNSKRYSEIGELFSDNAVFTGPNGARLQGKSAIADFYPSVVARLSPDEVVFQRCVSEGDLCAFELAARYDRSDGTSEIHIACDFITTDPSGMITEMAVYPRVTA